MPDFTEVFSKVRELHGQAARILSCSKSIGDGPGPAIEHDDEVFLLAELQIVLDMLADVEAYDDMFRASAIVESAITLLDILGGQSLSESDWSSATLRYRNDSQNDA